MANDVLLQMTDICKQFPGVKALDGVSLTVRRGTVHALMGENGAGKSTLMKCLFGIYEKNSGREDLHRLSLLYATLKRSIRHKADYFLIS